MAPPKTLFLALALLLTGTLSATAQCRDPWINQAYQQVANRKPVGTGDACECNKNLYNGGAWGSLNELVGYVRQVQQSGLSFGYAPLGTSNVMVVAQGGQIIAASLLDQGGNIVASGGGNIVASGGGNIVASGGGNIVASGGGNLTGLNKNTAGFGFGSSYGTLSVGQRRLGTSGKGAIVIK